jgi:hypothetical protein
MIGPENQIDERAKKMNNPVNPANPVNPVKNLFLCAFA